MITNIEETDLSLVDNYIFTADLDTIQVNKIITLDKNTYDKIDKIIVSNYGNRSRTYFKNVLVLVLYFNNIPDIYSIIPGMTIKLPDIDSLLSIIEQTEVFDEYDGIPEIPGINMSSVIHTNKNVNSANNRNNTANPKLGITKPEVTYNKSSGIVKY